jgi:hypothetical protein
MTTRKKTTKPQTDLIVTSGMKPAEFGAALIGEAQRRNDQARLEKSLVTVQGIMHSMSECKRQIEHLSSWQKTHEAQLLAIERGAFSFDAQGAIVYDDKGLNRK